jgi:hypothetical protein
VPIIGRLVLLVLAAAGLMAAPSAVRAAPADEVALAERYAPVMRQVAQVEECGPGEPYRPTDVDVLFGEQTVALRGPWGASDLVQIGPRAADLAAGLDEYHLDFPGDALSPGCTYETWARRLTAGSEPTAYAHVVADPDDPAKLVLQYWFFYPFNDYNNKHEGDWEGIQLVFEAPSAAAALGRAPVEVGYSQHESSERARWGDDKLELIDGTHPVVHVAEGSHANYFDDALYLGRSAESGVGCDNTTSPTIDIRPAIATIPSDPVAARQQYPWTAYRGRWGELHEAFYNGPTGPNLKDSWNQPVAASEGWHDRAYAVPAGGAFGTGATDFFCGAVAGGSDLLRQAVRDPGPTVAVLGLLAVLLVYALTRTAWRPSAPLRLARRRTWGQTLSAAGRMYARHPLLFIGIGLVQIPIAVIVAILQAALTGAVTAGGEGNSLLFGLAVAIGAVLTIFGVAIVVVATTRAMVELDADRPVGLVRAYLLVAGVLRPLLRAVAVAVAVVLVLTLSIVLIPLAVVAGIRWTLAVPALAVEGGSARSALRRSAMLTRRHLLKVVSLVLVAGAIVIVAGPLVGGLLILVTSAPFAVLNMVAGLVYAIAIPFVALTTAYVYFDLRTRAELDERAERDVLPAEIAIGADGGV